MATRTASAFDTTASATRPGFLAALAEGFRRWNDRRITTAALRRLSPAQLRDIGLEGVDLDHVAARLVR